jgi:lipopolysaccharide export system permease protein
MTLDLVDRHLIARHLRLFLGLLAAGCLLFAVVDFADRAINFAGPGWAIWTLRYYANRLPKTAVQLAPAAMLMAGGLVISGLRRRSELTPLLAAGRSPLRIAVPLMLSCLALGVLVATFDDLVAVRGALRAERINVEHFHVWGSYRVYFAPKRWLRLGPWIVHLGEAIPGGGAHDVTFFEMSDDFTLQKRIDAAAMVRDHPDGFKLVDVQERTFDGLNQTVARHPELPLPVTGGAALFELAPGRPEMMPRHELREQAALRKLLGLDSREHLFEYYSRLAFGLAGLAGLLWALVLALRANRRGHLNATFIEGVAIAGLLFGLLGLGKSLAIAGQVPAPIAAFAPVGVTLLLGAIALYRASLRPSL